MSSQIDISRSLAIPTVLTGGGLIPVPELVAGVTLRLIVEDFELGIRADIVDVNRRLPRIAGDITLRVEVAENIEGNIVLSGEETQERGFEIRELSVQFWPTEQPAEVAFVASTLNAALQLSRKLMIQVQDIGLDLALFAFDPPLLEVSKLLRERQTAYRLMVIERATGIDFGPLPTTIPGEDVAASGFVYHAIVDRTFIDGLRNIEVPTLANEEGSKILERLKNSPTLTFPNESKIVSKSLLGRMVTIGPQSVTVSDPYIENLDEIEEEIGRSDGRQLTIVVRSRTNRARYSLPEAPTLPAEPWEPAIQKLIDIESQLDSALMDRYNALAAGSLAGLTEEEKELVTRRPDICYPF